MPFVQYTGNDIRPSTNLLVQHTSIQAVYTVNYTPADISPILTTQKSKLELYHPIFPPVSHHGSFRPHCSDDELVRNSLILVNGLWPWRASGCLMIRPYLLAQLELESTKLQPTASPNHLSTITFSPTAVTCKNRNVTTPLESQLHTNQPSTLINLTNQTPNVQYHHPSPPTLHTPHRGGSSHLYSNVHYTPNILLQHYTHTKGSFHLPIH